MLRQVLGVDPGQNGGIALVGPSGRLVSARRIPVSDADLLALLKQLSAGGGAYAVLERTYAGPRMSKMSAKSFGESVGRIKMALSVTGWRVAEVMPKVWQTAMRCLSGGDKKVTHAAARARWPGAKVTHATADAMLIAEFGRRYLEVDAWQHEASGHRRKRRRKARPASERPARRQR